MRRLISREVERVATRKSRVFILRIEGLCTTCEQYAPTPVTVKLFLTVGEFFSRPNSPLPLRVAQPVTVLEKRIIVSVTNIDGNLGHRSRPRAGELAAGAIVAEQDIGHPLSLSAR